MMNEHNTYSMWSPRGDTFTVSTVSSVRAHDREEENSHRVTIIAVEISSDPQFVKNLLNIICQNDAVYVTEHGIDGPVATLLRVIWSFDMTKQPIDSSFLWQPSLIAFNLDGQNESLYALCTLVINKRAPFLVLRPYAAYDGRIAKVLCQIDMNEDCRIQYLKAVRFSNI